MTAKYLLMGAVSGLIFGLVLGFVASSMYADTYPSARVGDNAIVLQFIVAIITVASTIIGACLGNIIAQIRTYKRRK